MATYVKSEYKSKSLWPTDLQFPRLVVATGSANTAKVRVQYGILSVDRAAWKKA